MTFTVIHMYIHLNTGSLTAVVQFYKKQDRVGNVVLNIKTSACGKHQPYVPYINVCRRNEPVW